MPKWRVGGVSLPHGPYMIGAGVCKTPSTTAKWLKVAPVVSGSYTREPRPGNNGQVVYPATFDGFERCGYGLNSYGMPNMGFTESARQFRMIESEQPIIVSVAGFSITEYILGVETFGSLANVAALELNFGCPNTQGDHPEIISFSPGIVDSILHRIYVKGITDKPVWLKFSPYSNPSELKRVADIVNKYVLGLRLAVVTCNTFPNAYAGKGNIDPNNGLAGLSGSVMKPIALGQVKQFRQHLDEQIDVIGVGGITCGDDVMDFLDAGAKAVQIASLAHWAGDPGNFFEQLLKQETASRFMEYLTNDI